MKLVVKRNMEARNNHLLKKNETKKNKDSGRPSTDSPCKKKKITKTKDNNQ